MQDTTNDPVAERVRLRGVATTAQVVVWLCTAYAVCVVLRLRGVLLPLWGVEAILLAPLAVLAIRYRRRRPALMLAAGLAGLLIAVGAGVHAAHAAGLEGRWLTQNRKGVIEIGPCGRGGLCGRIAGMSNPRTRDHAGQPECGLVILRDVTPKRFNHWTARITDPRNGTVYPAEMRINKRGQLALRGYLGVPLFGSTQLWTPFRGMLSTDCAFR